jgi:VanZ family protein
MLIKNIPPQILLISPYLFWALICIVTTLLLMEHSESIVGFPHMDKIIHATLFAMLTAVGYLAYSKNSDRLYLGLMGYGIITECLQGLLTVTRYASLYDWIADSVGIVLCVLTIKIIKSPNMTKTTHVN